MIFEPLPIAGAFLVRTEPHVDDRGHFARIWCRDEFSAHGIASEMAQASVSFNRRAGTLRGLHFTWPPSQEAKLVRCGRGRIFDVLVDLRPASPSYLAHHAVEIDATRGDAVFIPYGVAHGFQTLDNDCEVVYMMTDRYRPELADGVRYNDPRFGIEWPMDVTAIADRDRTYPDFDPEAHQHRAVSAEAR